MTEDEVQRSVGRRKADLLLAQLAARIVANGQARRRRLMALGTVAGVVLAGMMFLIAVQRTNAINSARIEECREANLPNAFIRITLDKYLPEASDDADARLPILACRRTIEEGRPVRLTAMQEAAYLRIFERGRLPVVDGDGIVRGSEPLAPAAPG